jgi:tRNA(Ile)-lysidine synthase
MKQVNTNVKNHNFFLDDIKINSLYLNFHKVVQSIVAKKKFIVAVSGGPDSLALAYFAKIYSNRTNSQIEAVIVDHAIRKKSAVECKLTAINLTKIGVKNTTLKVQKKILTNIQKQARDERYKLMNACCKRKKVAYLLTAHHLDDQVENFYIRLSRGSGLNGLSSMKTLDKNIGNISIVRPLLSCKKKDLEYVTKKVFPKYVKDPSNDNDQFLRVRIRKLKNHLSKEGLDQDRLVKTIANLNSAKEALDFYVSHAYKKNIRFLKTKTEIDKRLFLKEPFEITYRAVTELIKKKSGKEYPPRSKGIENLIHAVQKKDFKAVTLGGFIFSNYKTKVRMSKETRKKTKI